jgi:hypothetical protein
MLKPLRGMLKPLCGMLKPLRALSPKGWIALGLYAVAFGYCREAAGLATYGSWPSQSVCSSPPPYSCN